ncbi:MAG: terminase large subunit domain-containing protein [Nitrosopumilaceae archaeon]
MSTSAFFPNVRKLVKSEPSSAPSLSKTDILNWAAKYRLKVEGKKRSLLLYPFWEDIYKDDTSEIMIMGGRQIFKSTFITDVLAFRATTQPDSTVIFVTHDNDNRDSFANQKFRQGCIRSNRSLRKLVDGFNQGSSNEVRFKNGSTIYFVTDENRYCHVEGKSPDEVIFDESQYQTLEYLPIVREACATTRGKIKIIGVGGEGGSEYEKLWQLTDQREWIYDDPFWRDKLRFMT